MVGADKGGAGGIQIQCKEQQNPNVFHSVSKEKAPCAMERFLNPFQKPK